MSPAENAHDVVDFFQKAFTVVLALALAESFKQFVADKADDEAERVIHWNRLWALVAFLFLIFPFFQGMNRYFYKEYISKPVMYPHYSIFLMFDGIAFTVEAALFFVMSRTLSPALSRRFYGSVLLLFIVDSIWALVSWMTHSVPIVPWLVLNVIFSLIFAEIILNHRGLGNASISHICAGLVVLRTVLDYALMWPFYFP